MDSVALHHINIGAIAKAFCLAFTITTEISFTLWVSTLNTALYANPMGEEKTEGGQLVSTGLARRETSNVL